MQEKYLEVHKDMFFTFVDLEKAYYRQGDQGSGVRIWCLRRRGVPEKL